MRRALAILIEFERKTGYSHSRRDGVLLNYADLLTAMGKSKSESGIRAAIAALMADDGGVLIA